MYRSPRNPEDIFLFAYPKQQQISIRKRTWNLAGGLNNEWKFVQGYILANVVLLIGMAREVSGKKANTTCFDLRLDL